MKKNADRKIAEETFLKERGRITNKELSRKLAIHPATVSRWKKLDEWDLKLVQSVGLHDQTAMEPETDFYATDLRHLSLLNDRIDAYLKKKELLPSEILALAEAKFHIMNCMEIVSEPGSWPLVEESPG